METIIISVTGILFILSLILAAYNMIYKERVKVTGKHINITPPYTLEVILSTNTMIAQGIALLILAALLMEIIL